MHCMTVAIFAEITENECVGIPSPMADPGLSGGRGVRFRQGHRDAKVVDGNRVWGEVSPPFPIEVRSGEELFPSCKFLWKKLWEYYILLYFHALVNNF